MDREGSLDREGCLEARLERGFEGVLIATPLRIIGADSSCSDSNGELVALSFDRPLLPPLDRNLPELPFLAKRGVDLLLAKREFDSLLVKRQFGPVLATRALLIHRVEEDS